MNINETKDDIVKNNENISSEIIGNDQKDKADKNDKNVTNNLSKKEKSSSWGKKIIYALVIVLAFILIRLAVNFVYFGVESYLNGGSFFSHETAGLDENLAGYFQSLDEADDNSLDNNRSKHVDDYDIYRQKAAKLLQAIAVLKENYYQDKSVNEIVDILLKGGVDNMGSKFTRYLSPDEFKDFQERVEGEYYGIGARIHIFRGHYFISSIINNSPAANSDLQADDEIVAIDGKQIRNFKNSEDVFRYVRGQEGTKVVLTVKRGNLPPELDGAYSRGEDLTKYEEEDEALRKKNGGVPIYVEVVESRDQREVLNIEITRGAVKNPDVKLEFLNDIAYIRLYEFNSHLGEEFAKALQQVKNRGIDKIIFDFRYNPGGSAGELQKCLNLLLDKGTIATIRGRENNKLYEETWESDEGKFFDYDVSYAALVNEETASASEFFCGAMRDRADMVLVGSTTYGKGVATGTYPLEDKSAINVTTFEYILPKGEHLHNKGLTPEYLVEQSDKYKDYDPDIIPRNEDLVLQKAIEVLHGTRGR